MKHLLMLAILVILGLGNTSMATAFPCTPGDTMELLGNSDASWHQPLAGGQKGTFTMGGVAGGRQSRAWGTQVFVLDGVNDLYLADCIAGTSQLLPGSFGAATMAVDTGANILWANMGDELRKYPLPYNSVNYTVVATDVQLPSLQSTAYFAVDPTSGCLVGNDSGVFKAFILSGAGICGAGPPAETDIDINLTFGGSEIGLAVDASGTIYAADSNSDVLWKVPPGGPAAVLNLSPDITPHKVTFDAENNRLIVVGYDNSMVPAEVPGEVNTTTGVLTVWDTGPTVGVQDVTTLFTPLTCGDGIFDNQVEQCDRSAGGHSVCCREDCTFEAAATSCTDGNPCNGDEMCTGLGVCAGGEIPNCDDANDCTADGCGIGGCFHDPVPAEGLPCGAGNLCHTGRTCAAGVCQGGSSVNCSDGSACTSDSCIPETGLCERVPIDTIVMMDGQASSLKLQDKPDDGDFLQAQIKGGPELGPGPGSGAAGNPVAPGGTTQYHVCLLDQIGPDNYRVLFEQLIQPGGVCKDKPCWVIKGKPGKETGLVFKDPNGDQGDITELSFKFGVAGKSKVTLKSKKRNLTGFVPFGPEYLSQNSDAVVRIIGTHGTGWRMDFNAPAIKNDGTKGLFSDKAP